ncbi:esterase-like activity of phytase family protein [Sedimentitalea sp. HM32M-2]|uniref:esterase-like activity of phytase family protein n=1 Tax=Sedimentitalea sp. HM32M-2 TaxID=3351566 RepID=UPI003645516F
MRLGPALGLIAALLVASAPARAACQRAELLGSFTWDLPRDGFGGFSGLELSGDGQRMIAITDRARVVFATLQRQAGRITGVVPRRWARLRGQNGALLIGHIVDSEGLAIAPDDSLFISFERVHRVSHYATPTTASRGLHRAAGFRDMPRNGGFEALAIDAAGRLFALPEDGQDAQGRIPLYRWQNGVWSQPFDLIGDDRFLPVGADFGPDGRFYVLERGYNLFGFRSRVRSWRLSETGARDERCELQTATGTHDNLEGLAIWRDAGGRLRLTMIADDNFFFLQRTELVEYVLQDGQDGVAHSAVSR